MHILHKVFDIAIDFFAILVYDVDISTMLPVSVGEQ